MHYAGFWRRLVATLLDYVLVLTLLLPFFLIYYRLPLSFQFVANHWLLNLVWFSGIILFWSLQGATPGKRLMHCKIVHTDGVTAISTKTALIRALLYVVSALPLFAGFIGIAFESRKRGFHDMLAKTVVLVDEENYDQQSLAELMESASK
ncbi:MAG: RDD family protein [Gammaproteobacteria bacterium]|nr:MAG: RDD family protein [Gammaproteobacteria bacterium]